MSTFAKVMVVLVLLASGVLLGVTATLFAYRTDYRNELARTRDKAKNDVAVKEVEIQKLRDELALAGAQVSALQMNIETLRSQLAASQNDAKGWQDRNNTLLTELGKLTDQYKAIADQIGEKDKAIQQLTADLQTAREAVEVANKAKDASDQHALDLQTRLTAAEKSLIELEKSYVALSKRLQGAQ